MPTEPESNQDKSPEQICDGFLENFTLRDAIKFYLGYARSMVDTENFSLKPKGFLAVMLLLNHKLEEDDAEVKSILNQDMMKSFNAQLKEDQENTSSTKGVDCLTLREHLKARQAQEKQDFWCNPLVKSVTSGFVRVGDQNPSAEDLMAAAKVTTNSPQGMGALNVADVWQGSQMDNPEEQEFKIPPGENPIEAIRYRLNLGHKALGEILGFSEDDAVEFERHHHPWSVSLAYKLIDYAATQGLTLTLEDIFPRES